MHIIIYFNKWINNLYKFDKFEIEDLFYSFKYILESNNVTSSKDLFYLKGTDLKDDDKPKTNLPLRSYIRSELRSKIQHIVKLASDNDVKYKPKLYGNMIECAEVKPIVVSNHDFHKDLKRIAKKTRQLVNRCRNEANQSFLIALRSISNSFPQDLFYGVFINKRLDLQIKIANIFLTQRKNMVLKDQQPYTVSLENLILTFEGKFIAIIKLDGYLHCEAINDHQYGSLIKKPMLERKDDCFTMNCYDWKSVMMND
jgi:hypothetical protein